MSVERGPRARRGTTAGRRGSAGARSSAVASCGAPSRSSSASGPRRVGGAARRRPASCGPAAPSRAAARGRRRASCVSAAVTSSVAASASIERARLRAAPGRLAGHGLGVGDEVAQRRVLAVDLGQRAVGRREPRAQVERGAVEVVAALVDRPRELGEHELDAGPLGRPEGVEQVVEARRDERVRAALASPSARHAIVGLAVDLAAAASPTGPARRRRSCRRSCPAGGSPPWRRRVGLSIVLVEQQRDLGEALVVDLILPTEPAIAPSTRTFIPSISGNASSNWATTWPSPGRAARTGRGRRASAPAAAPSPRT